MRSGVAVAFRAERMTPAAILSPGCGELAVPGISGPGPAGW